MGHKDPLEEEMSAQSSILTGLIPWAEEPGEHNPWGSQTGLSD